jgi:hypothetical protein
MSKKKTDESYELLTVAELKELADQQGIEIPSDARKDDIIEALQASDQLERPDPAAAGPKEGNTYEYQTSSTETALMSEEDFWRTKLVS